LRGKRDDADDLRGVYAGVAPERCLTEGVHRTVLSDQSVSVDRTVIIVTESNTSNVLTTGLVASGRAVKHGVAKAEYTAVFHHNIVSLSGGRGDDPGSDLRVALRVPVGLGITGRP
jgi:hypothetical protein